MQLRERKKQLTREAIQREALRLIAEQGYPATTCEQIAAAADISTATLFRYFPTKEDLVLQDVYDLMIAEAVRGRPAREGALTAVRRGLSEAMAAVYDTDLEQIRQRTQLILSVPARGAARASRTPAWSVTRHRRWPSVRAPLRTTSPWRSRRRGLRGGARGAVERWVRLGGDLPQHVDEALAALGAVARRPPR